MAATTEVKSEIKPENKSGSTKTGPSNNSTSNTTLPKDGQVMVAILKDMGVSEFEPKVINHLLDFSYRYATNILEDAKVISAHAKKRIMDVDDVKLAVQMYTEQNVTTPPNRDFLLDVARLKNATPLPIPKTTCGLRLPPERHCLTACNYKMKQKPKPKPSGYGGTSLKGPAVVRYGALPAKVVLPGSGQHMPGFSVVNTVKVQQPVTNIQITPQGNQPI